MFSECKLTLNFYSVILGFNYSTSNMSADNWYHFNFPPYKPCLTPILPVTLNAYTQNNLMILFFYRMNAYAISQFHTQE